ncbi:TIGR04104 family putative zinc finger protein [Pradoshia sp.]
MPTCQRCREKWSWFYTIKEILKFRKRMKCQRCREIQYETKSSRNKVNLFILIPFIINPLCMIYDLPNTAILLVNIMLIVGILFHAIFIKTIQ